VPFTLPIFNLLTNYWTAGHTPAADPPDIVDVPSQLYVFSRLGVDQVAASPTLYTPPIMIRQPLGAYLAVVGDIAEAVPGSADYYKVRWVQVFHLGFPNQYLGVLVEQCNSAGATPRP